MNWCFSEVYFLQSARLLENAPILAHDLLPTRINFELGSHFSTTCIKICPSMRRCIGAFHVGGEGDLSRFLHVWDDLAYPEHDYFADWGKQQGFEKYSLAKYNRQLSRREDFRAKEV